MPLVNMSWICQDMTYIRLHHEWIGWMQLELRTSVSRTCWRVYQIDGILNSSENYKTFQLITSLSSHLTYKKHYEMKHEMTRWKCFVQTHLLFVTIYGLVWSSSVTLNIRWRSCAPMCHWLRDITLSSNGLVVSKECCSTVLWHSLPLVCAKHKKYKLYLSFYTYLFDNLPSHTKVTYLHTWHWNKHKWLVKVGLVSCSPICYI